MEASSKPPELAEYPVTIVLPIQWGDMDAFGHVNNTVHIRWFESARIAYLHDIGLGEMMSRHEGGPLGPILASITCHYRRQVDFPDTVEIGSRISKVGRSSLSMHHAVYSRSQQAVCADGDSVLVVFDYESQRPVRVPAEVRGAIGRAEGKSFD